MDPASDSETHGGADVFRRHRPERIYRASSLPPSPARWSGRRANLSMQLLPTPPASRPFRWMARPPTAPRPWPPHDRREDAQRGHFHVVRHGGRGRRGQAIRLGRRQHLPPTNGTPAQTLLVARPRAARWRRVDHARRPRHATTTPYRATATTPSPNNRRRDTRTTTPVSATASTCCWAADSAQAAQPGQQAHRRRQSGDGLPGQGLYLRRHGHRAR